MGAAHQVLRTIKNALVKDEVKLHRVMFGISSGCLLPLNLRHKTHVALGLYEKEVYGRVAKAIRPESVFYDVGAGYGYYVVGVAKRLVGGQIWAFEGDPAAAELLRQAIQANGAGPKVHSIDAYVSDVASEGFTTIDATVQAGAPAPDLIKIDVEGAEMAVLRGAEAVIAADRPILFIETHSKTADEECQDFLRAHGYRIDVIESKSFREARPIDFNRWLWADN